MMTFSSAMNSTWVRLNDDKRIDFFPYFFNENILVLFRLFSNANFMLNHSSREQQDSQPICESGKKPTYGICSEYTTTGSLLKAQVVSFLSLNSYDFSDV
jgi:hypothetical protein